MKKIDAIRKAVDCPYLDLEVRATLLSILNKYEIDKTHSFDYQMNKRRRAKILQFISSEVPMTAEEICEQVNAEYEKETPPLHYAYSANSVAGLLRKAVEDGAVVIDHKEKATIVIPTGSVTPLTKEVSINFYRKA